MPPILSDKDEQDFLFSLCSPSVVTVHRDKEGKRCEDFGIGFIIFCDNKKTLVCVDPSIIEDGEDLSVTFNDNTTHASCIFFNDENCTHAVLVVKTPTIFTWNQVTFCEDPVRREAVFTIAAVENGEPPGLMTGNTITTDCTALREDGTFVIGSGDLFAMSCPSGGVSADRSKGNANRIVGAAVFNMEGKVIGTIKSIDPKPFDVKFSMRVVSFLTALEQSLQARDKKVLFSRGQNVSQTEKSTAGDRMSQQGGTISGSGSKDWSLDHVPESSPQQDAMLPRRQKEIRQSVVRLLTRVSDKQVSKMLPVSTLCSNGKRQFGTNNGGDLHLGAPYEEDDFGNSSDSGHSVSKHIASNLDGSVVAIASFNEGGSIHFACVGIVFDLTETRAYILTSLNLFRSSDDSREINFKIKIEVRLPNDQVVNGTLIFHDLNYNLCIVSVLPIGGVCAAFLDHQQHLESHSQVVSVQRCFSSGKLMATAGLLADDPTGAYPEEAATEGLFMDSLGNLVGLNCYAKKGTTLITRSTILEFVAGFQKACAEKRARAADLRRRLASRWELRMKKFRVERRVAKLKAWSPSQKSSLEGSSTMEKKQSACHYCDLEGQTEPGDRSKRLFPGPSWPADADEGGMRLLCSFEEEFGDDIWSKLTEQVASDMSPSVVALASFNGTDKPAELDCKELKMSTCKITKARCY